MSATISEITLIWENVLKELKKQIHERFYDTFFADTKALGIKDKTITVGVSTSTAAVLISQKFQDTINDILLKVTGTDLNAKFVEGSSSEKVQEAEKFDKTPHFFKDSKLDRSFSFDKFVVGTCNLEAYQASLMISSTPGQLYNPLVLYSGPGLGKTHLIQAIGNAAKESSPNTKVLYTSTSGFIDEYIKFASGYKEDKSLIDYFKNDVDIFLIDDIQLLKNKPKTMEMFFTVFQNLIDSGKQIVITSDQPPAVLDGFDERLKSRFSKGLVLNINPPDVETCKKILKVKILQQNLNPDDFDEDVIEYLATKFNKNVRELEGALLRLIFYAVTIRPTKHISMAFTTEAIKPLLDSTDDKDELTENKIILVVANYYSLTPSQITGKIRTARVALARHIAMYLDRELLKTPLIKIGQTFGGRDHSTVLNGIGKVEKELKDNPDMEIALKELKTKLAS
ncbi:MAG: chromosomal replication initiator protein DnaA [Bacilli bacterium]|nr:chromosomal replication initiator protein DnaA [Bacilli bacterium]